MVLFTVSEFWLWLVTLGQQSGVYEYSLLSCIKICIGQTIFLLSIRSCKTVVIVCFDHIVVDRLCVRRKLDVIVSSLWQGFVKEHYCVFGLSYLVLGILSEVHALLVMDARSA